jgi:transcriptional regulator with XRE-family HTH domain
MKLARYLAARGMTQAEFAARIGVTPDTVSLWVNEHKLPRPPRLAAIIRVTRAKVGPRDFTYKRPRRRGG